MNKRTRVLTRANVYEVISLNDQYTDRDSDVRFRMMTDRPLAILGQEGKGQRYAKLLQDAPGVGVTQFTDTPALQGSFIAWDEEIAEAVGHGGYLALAIPNKGDALLIRYVVWQDVRIIKTGRIVRLAAAHRPLHSTGEQGEFDRKLKAWLRTCKVPVILGMDGNTPRLTALRSRLGMTRQVGAHIDTVMVKGKGVRLLLKAKRLAKRHSDHTPISALVRIGRARKNGAK